MTVALLDDETAILSEMKALLAEYADINKTDFFCDCFTSGSALLAAGKYDVYFLDYLMPEMNGVTVAVGLQKKFGNSFTVCYLTSYENAAIDVINHRVNAEAFLTKPLQREQLFAVMDGICKKNTKDRIVLKRNRETVLVCPQDILYIEAMRKKCIFYYDDREEEFPYKFSDLEENYLPKHLFSQIHRSYLVNLRQIAKYDNSTVTLCNGAVLSVTRSKEFRADINRFNFESFQ